MAKGKIPYNPKKWQTNIHKSKKNFMCIIAHRGAGKTYASLIEGFRRSLNKKGKYLYLAPFLKQAIDNVWDEVKKLLHDVPDVIYHKQQSSFTLPNGSKWFLRGADNPSGLRGGHYDGMFVDEMQNISKHIWYSTIYPMCRARKGWVICMGTPMDAEDLLMTTFHRASENEGQEALVFDVYKAGNFTKEEIKQMEKEYPPEEWAREYLCLPVPSMTASVYGDVISHLTNEGKFDIMEYDPNLPVYVAWDIGLQYKTALWFAQFNKNGKSIRVLEYYENDQKHMSHYLNYLWSRPYTYGCMILPHDTTRGNWKDDYTTVAKEFINKGYKVMTVPKTGSVVKDIRAVRIFMARCEFDEEKTRAGTHHLRFYEYRQDKRSGIVSNQIKKSNHNDGADAFRYLALGMTEINPNKTVYEIDQPLQVKASWDELEG